MLMCCPIGFFNSASGLFEIPRAVMLDGSADYFSRTPGSVGNRKIWTFSCWVKRGTVTLSGGTLYPLLSAGTDAANYHQIYYSDDYLTLGFYDGTNSFFVNFGNAKHRDPTSWYHYVVVWDTTQVTPASRFRAYCNGVLMTGITASAYPSLDFDGYVCGTLAHRIGANFDPSYFNGYIASPVLVDGAALTPSSFGEVDAATGSWKPKRPSGLTYGTNGFWLDFANTSDLGNDAAGANDWAPTSITSANAGGDTPTNNFATLNALYTGKSTLSNGNLTASGSTDLPTIMPDSGNWYFEIGGVAKNWTPPAAFPAAAGTYNFGQYAFSNTPTSGYKTLCTANLPVPSIKDPGKQMDVLAWTGDGTNGRSITGLDFTPDFVWIKNRTTANWHCLVDAVRGASKTLATNSTGAENAGGASDVVSLDASGFTINATANWYLNNSGASLVAWCWKAGGVAVSNTDGTITAQVSANPTAGFSVGTYTSPSSSSDQTVGHGLGASPALIIVKNLDDAFNWDIYHKSLGYNSSLTFTTNGTRSGAFNSTINSTVFGTKVGYTHYLANRYVFYAWAEIPNFSKFGSYTGNGSADGPFVYCGFRPRWLLVKCSSASGKDWELLDTSRDTFNVASAQLLINVPNSEASVAAVDITASGFKVKITSGNFNDSAATYVFAAFAEYPFGGGANFTPGKAR